jgi:hypothetical protein
LEVEMPETDSLARTAERPGPRARQGGQGLAESVVCLALIAVVTTVSIPHLAEARRAAALRAVAQQVSGLVARCRSWAVLHDRNTALVFERAGAWQCFVAVDGDGDGVRSDDIRAGRDPVVGAKVRLREGDTGLGILTSEPVPDPSGSGWLGGDLSDPVRAGSGNMISFSAVGTATSASVFMTDNRSQMRVVRVFAATGRTRSMVWKSGWERWRQGSW